MSQIGPSGPIINSILRGSGTVELEITQASFNKEFYKNLRVLARSLATTAANSIRKDIADKFKSLIIQRIMADPDVQKLSDQGSQLVAALGIASAANVDGYIRQSLEKNMLDSSSGAGVGSGGSIPTKGSRNSLPLTFTGFSEGGVDNFFSEPWGTYTSTNFKTGKSYEIPWLSWMKDPVGVKVAGSSVEFGDFPNSRTGNARMKRGGSFSIRRFLAGDDKNILERTLTNQGFLRTLEKKYAEKLESAMNKSTIQDRAKEKAKFKTVTAASNVGTDLDQVAAPASSDPAKQVDVVGEITERLRALGQTVTPEDIETFEKLRVSDPALLIEIVQGYGA